MMETLQKRKKRKSWESLEWVIKSRWIPASNFTSWVCDHIQPRAASTFPGVLSHATDHNSNLKTDGPKLTAHLQSGLPGREFCHEMAWGFKEGI